MNEKNKQIKTSYNDLANAIRFLSIDAIEKANSGHPGMPMGMADIAAVLFGKFLKFDTKNPMWPNRDRFILSNGHGSMLLYSLLYLTGYDKITIEDIKNFRQLNYITAGHPEKNQKLGIETTTGPLGQGLANSVGFALAEKVLSSYFGSEIINHFTYVFAGDGCLMEGISQEAISLAGHLKLNKLIVFFDDNSITIDGSTKLSTSDNQIERFKASQWDVHSIDGHNHKQIEQAIKAAKKTSSPSLISCKTIIAYGSPNKAGSSSSHGAPFGKEEIQKIRENLKWNSPPFKIPKLILDSWRKIGASGNTSYKKWKSAFDKLDNNLKQEFIRRQKKELPKNINVKVTELIKYFLKEKPLLATRESSELVIDVLRKSLPELIGGSADLTDSNKTKPTDMKIITKENFLGNYIHYGIREHAMAACMNGLSLYGGIIPYGGTFLVFSDYCRPSIRLSALMKTKVIYIMSHDSIGLGEDGPTHQPIEQLASLRAIPNLRVFRPADNVETAESWLLALKYDGPSLIALSRQKTNPVREKFTTNMTYFGAYNLIENNGKVKLIASGSEVFVAVKVHELLKEKGILSSVISMPCWELFEEQNSKYKENILGNDTFKVTIEAASTFGWNKYVCNNYGLNIGLESFGLSAPYKVLYDHFNLTPSKITELIINKFKG